MLQRSAVSNARLAQSPSSDLAPAPAPAPPQFPRLHLLFCFHRTPQRAYVPRGTYIGDVIWHSITITLCSASQPPPRLFHAKVMPSANHRDGPQIAVPRTWFHANRFVQRAAQKSTCTSSARRTRRSKPWQQDSATAPIFDEPQHLRTGDNRHARGPFQQAFLQRCYRKISVRVTSYFVLVKSLTLVRAWWLLRAPH